MRKGRKIDNRLAARRADFDKGKTSDDKGPAQRWASKGYHRPGSNKK